MATNTRLLTLDGVTKTLSDWARDSGVLVTTLHYRLKRMPLREALQQRIPRKTNHPLFLTWRGMCERCENPKSVGYRWYGAKGITVCAEWREDFWRFAEDMGERPEDHTLDRIDSTKGYSKANCRWADWPTQMRWVTRKPPKVKGPRKNSADLTYNGVTKTLKAWAEELNVSKFTLYTRRRLGWSAAQILFGPVRQKEAA